MVPSSLVVSSMFSLPFSFTFFFRLSRFFPSPLPLSRSLPAPLPIIVVFLFLLPLVLRLRPNTTEAPKESKIWTPQVSFPANVGDQYLSKLVSFLSTNLGNYRRTRRKKQDLWFKVNWVMCVDFCNTPSKPRTPARLSLSISKYCICSVYIYRNVNMCGLCIETMYRGKFTNVIASFHSHNTCVLFLAWIVHKR